MTQSNAAGGVRQSKPPGWRKLFRGTACRPRASPPNPSIRSSQAGSGSHSVPAISGPVPHADPENLPAIATRGTQEGKQVVQGLHLVSGWPCSVKFFQRFRRVSRDSLPISERDRVSCPPAAIPNHVATVRFRNRPARFHRRAARVQPP